MTRIIHRLFFVKIDSMSGCDTRLVFTFPPKDSTLQYKNAYTSEITLLAKENRIYIRGELRESLGMNLFSPFQPEREFKVYKSCKCSQIICSRVH